MNAFKFKWSHYFVKFNCRHKRGKLLTLKKNRINFIKSNSYNVSFSKVFKGNVKNPIMAPKSHEIHG